MQICASSGSHSPLNMISRQLHHSILILFVHFVPQLHTGGIIILKDTSEEEEELVEPVSAHGPKIEEEEQEPEAPEPFEYIDE